MEKLNLLSVKALIRFVLPVCLMTVLTSAPAKAATVNDVLLSYPFTADMDNTNECWSKVKEAIRPLMKEQGLDPRLLDRPYVGILGQDFTFFNVYKITVRGFLYHGSDYFFVATVLDPEDQSRTDRIGFEYRGELNYDEKTGSCSVINALFNKETETNLEEIYR